MITSKSDGFVKFLALVLSGIMPNLPTRGRYTANEGRTRRRLNICQKVATVAQSSSCRRPPVPRASPQLFRWRCEWNYRLMLSLLVLLLLISKVCPILIQFLHPNGKVWGICWKCTEGAKRVILINHNFNKNDVLCPEVYEYVVISFLRRISSWSLLTALSPTASRSN